MQKPNEVAPSRFQGGGVGAPTPTAGIQGAAVVRDNKTGTTVEMQGRKEQGGFSVEGKVTTPLPEQK